MNLTGEPEGKTQRTKFSDHAEQTSMRVHWPWLGVWACLTMFATFEIIKHGYVNGSTTDAMVLTASACAAFVAPDLTFVIGAGQPAPKGSLPTRAVPWYNTMHRMWIPLTITSTVAIALAPLTLAGLAGFVGGLSWMAHIALDRAAGYGLRKPDGSRSRT